MSVTGDSPLSPMNVWANHCEGSYKVNGTTLEQLVELPNDNIKFSYHINVTSIADDEMQTVTNNETFVNGQTHRWEYKADGTFVYYRQNDQGEWIDDVNTMAEYFVDGTLLCMRWKNVGDDTEKRESWEIASIEDGKMNWTALRQNEDGSTYTTTFEMTRMNP